ncbi:hypothetical protein [Solibacillus sp. FSL K6-1523]|uniref:hypothetical protein n=1 Tax=Solibacillus sp. FSL K6-1523 TaxID=2921471 RepID=UPI0030FA4D0B
MKKLTCLHAHHSNIPYIENLLKPYPIEISHHVDPGLMDQIKNNPNFDRQLAKEKVHAQITWLASTNPDAILITCTNYIALMDSINSPSTIPLIKIDEPFFEKICSITAPQIIVFTNPDTVDGRLARLNDYAKRNGINIDIDVRILPDAFSFIMKGLKNEHDALLAAFMDELIQTEKKVTSVAQLSMVDVARQMSAKHGIHIVNPLDALTKSIVDAMDLPIC